MERHERRRRQARAHLESALGVMREAGGLCSELAPAVAEVVALLESEEGAESIQDAAERSLEQPTAAPCIQCGKHPAALGYLCEGCSDEAQSNRFSAMENRMNAAHLASLTRPSPTPSMVPWGEV